MTLSAGARLGPYEILSPLGAGGMGEVYRARDTRLGREVAIKVLAEHMADRPALRERFEREAKAISSLNHPHICSLFDVGSQDDVDYLVMELLEGETLEVRLRRGPLPTEQVCRYGMEIADALGKAHRQGIVHRDLKPGNVMLTKIGVKLLDFGLAKYLGAAAMGGIVRATDLPTESLPSGPLTEKGALVGTYPYMAPEQLEGGEADARTDIFALGCVLYEMASGRRAFSGKSRASLAGAILKEEPPSIASIQAAAPPALEQLVRACLTKDPEERLQTAHDVKLQLQWIGAGCSQLTARPAAARGWRRRERLAWTLAALAILFGVLAALYPHRTGEPQETLRFMIPPPSGKGFIGSVQLSPDGRRLLLLQANDSGKISVGVRSLDNLEVRRIPAADDVRGAFWSPDSREIAFFSDGKLKRVDADGGAAQTVCDSGGAFSGAWGSRGTILFEMEWGGPIMAVSATGGALRPVTAVDTAEGDVANAHPSFLPDGTHFVFVAPNVDRTKTSLVLASLDSKEVRRLFHADSSAVFAEPGYLLFGRDDAVLAWRFDPRRLKLVGDAVPAFQHVHWLTADFYLGCSAAGDRVAYQSWSLSRRLVWVDRTGRELGTLGETGGYTDVRFSPDGRNLAVAARDVSRARNLDIWVLDATRGTATRVTADRNDEFNPAWFPRGDRLVYVSDRFGFYDLFERPASSGPETPLVRTMGDKVSPTVLPDGRHILADSLSDAGRHTRVLVDLVAGGEPKPLSGDSVFSEEHPEASPDGRWIAFDSDESGQGEVYVQAMPRGPKRQVSIGGGRMPVWCRSAPDLFYVAPDGMLKSVTLRRSGAGLEVSGPQSLFLLGLGVDGELPRYCHPYDVSPDGQRFLVIRASPDAEPDGAVVVTNWTKALKESR
ncbi:MAG: protein kinase [Acidobacteriota bacterium]